MEKIVFGDGYECWAVAPRALTADSVVYSFGIGKDIDWDLAMIERFGVQIHAFDPTPLSKAWLSTQATPPEFHHHDYGIAEYDGTARFLAPEGTDDPNFLAADAHGLAAAGTRDRVIELPVASLATIMRRLNHQHVDIMKLDVEGAEYDVLSSMLRDGILPGQILVEFHHNFDAIPFRRSLEMVRRLAATRYDLFYISKRSYNFCFLGTR